MHRYDLDIKTTASSRKGHKEQNKCVQSFNIRKVTSHDPHLTFVIAFYFSMLFKIKQVQMFECEIYIVHIPTPWINKLFSF
jgi:hypothetical protein